MTSVSQIAVVKMRKAKESQPWTQAGVQSEVVPAEPTVQEDSEEEQFLDSIGQEPDIAGKFVVSMNCFTFKYY